MACVAFPRQPSSPALASALASQLPLLQLLPLLLLHWASSTVCASAAPSSSISSSSTMPSHGRPHMRSPSGSAVRQRCRAAVAMLLTAAGRAPF